MMPPTSIETSWDVGDEMVFWGGGTFLGEWTGVSHPAHFEYASLKFNIHLYPAAHHTREGTTCDSETKKPLLILTLSESMHF
jgi:hypothetical protein